MSILIKKTIIVLITIIMVSNFIMPNEVQAVSWSKVGKDLINGLFDLLRFIADLFLQVMQKMMVGTWDIASYTGDSEILYSPGIIFLDRVAGLKINFIGDNEYKTEVKNNLAHLESDQELIDIMKLIDKNGYKMETIYKFQSIWENDVYVGNKLLKGEYTSEYLNRWGLKISSGGNSGGPVFLWSNMIDSKVIFLTAEYRT